MNVKKDDVKIIYFCNYAKKIKKMKNFFEGYDFLAYVIDDYLFVTNKKIIFYTFLSQSIVGTFEPKFYDKSAILLTKISKENRGNILNNLITIKKAVENIELKSFDDIFKMIKSDFNPFLTTRKELKLIPHLEPKFSNFEVEINGYPTQLSVSKIFLDGVVFNVILIRI